MPNLRRTTITVCLPLLLTLTSPAPGKSQESNRLFPDRSSMPSLGGPRDPTTSASLLYVGSNPNDHGVGVEAEVALGITLPVILLAGALNEDPVVVGLEAGVFSRFGLQVVERELIATDWVFAIPVYWHRSWGWFRFRYFHSSSHLGDEYARRFEEPGVNFSRDAAEVLGFKTLGRGKGIYGGARFAYNVHPEESRRWVLRAGAKFEVQERHRPLRPFLAADLEWDQDARGTRLQVAAGTWLPEVAGKRVFRLAIGVLTGPSPLGQFNGLHTVQAGFSLSGRL